MQCPRCNHSLVVIERNEVELDWCPKCQGFWLDAEEVDILRYKLGISYDVPNPLDADITKADDKMLKCPKCKSYMGKVNINGVIIDKCMKRHGMWFDKNELSEFFNKFSSQNEGRNEAVKFFGEVFNIK